MDYSSKKEDITCEELDCEVILICRCSKCFCCSICTARCGCPAATTDHNKKMAQVLGFGDLAYRLANIYGPDVAFITYRRVILLVQTCLTKLTRESCITSQQSWKAAIALLWPKQKFSTEGFKTKVNISCFNFTTDAFCLYYRPTWPYRATITARAYITTKKVVNY